MSNMQAKDAELEKARAQLVLARFFLFLLFLVASVALGLNQQVRQAVLSQLGLEPDFIRDVCLTPNGNDIHELTQSEWPRQPNFSLLSTNAKEQYEKLGPFLGQEIDLSLDWGHQVRDSGEYTGQLNSRHQMHGYGRYVYFNGGIYDGYWRNGMRSGLGRFIDSEGKVYAGEWVKDKREGGGMTSYVDGSMYVGTRVNDNKQGFGSMKSGNETKHAGDQICGEWFLDKLDGRAVYFYQNGTIYAGNFQAYKKYGQGMIGYPDGRMCSGEWNNDELSGTGTCLYPNGDVYRGEWVNGLKSGNGTLTHPGLVDKGVWTNDVLG